jgi:hypothetical protein
MSGKILIASALLFVVGLPSAAEDKPAKEKEYRGKLRTGLVAIGGETTGYAIETEDGKSLELDFGKSKDLARQADKLDRKMVVVQGVLEVRKGVERKTRSIIKVSSLQAAK